MEVFCLSILDFHRIVESLRSEKTSKIIKSNHQPNTTLPAKPSPKNLVLFLSYF